MIYICFELVSISFDTKLTIPAGTNDIPIERLNVIVRPTKVPIWPSWAWVYWKGDMITEIVF